MRVHFVVDDDGQQHQIGLVTKGASDDDIRGMFATAAKALIAKRGSDAAVLTIQPPARSDRSPFRVE